MFPYLLCIPIYTSPYHHGIGDINIHPKTTSFKYLFKPDCYSIPNKSYFLTHASDILATPSTILYVTCIFCFISSAHLFMNIIPQLFQHFFCPFHVQRLLICIFKQRNNSLKWIIFRFQPDSQ